MNVESKYMMMVKAASLMLGSDFESVTKFRQLVNATVVGNYENDPFAIDDAKAREYLEFVAELEGGTGDVDGPYIGPFQFGKAAWSESSSAPYWPGALYYDVAARAALNYMYLNRNRFMRSFPNREFTKEIGYLYHNQGPTGAAHFLRTGELKWPKQSRKALEVFSSI